MTLPGRAQLFAFWVLVCAAVVWASLSSLQSTGSDLRGGGNTTQTPPNPLELTKARSESADALARLLNPAHTSNIRTGSRVRTGGGPVSGVVTSNEFQPRIRAIVIDEGGFPIVFLENMEAPAGKILSVGDEVDGWRVSSIFSTTVAFERDGRTFVYRAFGTNDGTQGP